LHISGEFTRLGEEVSPGTPAVLHPLPPTGTRRSNRLDLARWLVAPENPLTARVVVNRVWQHYFGLGLVETENDFGTQGSLPSHPELLDWLATEFHRREWTLKEMHRLIVTSATYRQSSRVRPELAEIDPRNRLLARQNRLRLDAEILRDTALASAGVLVPILGGPSVYPPQSEGVYSHTDFPKDWPTSTGPNRYRRGLYTFFWRSAPFPALVQFDAPESIISCTRRNRSNTPLQALTLLNDGAYFELARVLAERVLRDRPGESDAVRVRYAFRLCLCRLPTAAESTILEQFVAGQQRRLLRAPQEVRQLVGAETASDDLVTRRAAYVLLARLLFNLDEFVTRE
jgi:hypothetical protein